MNGFLCVDKPRGPSSFSIISQTRRLLKTRKVGHCGTLDPEAEGLLLVAVGSSTRLLRYVKTEPKGYEFGIQFGSETDSFDLEGRIVADGGRFPSESELHECLKQFKGKILQTPPLFSAIKIEGTRACDLVRKGVTPELKEREITVHHLESVSYDSTLGIARLIVSCSTGTYVRSLVRDIAHACGTFGTATFIKRTKIGDFSIDDAIALDTITSLEERLISNATVFKNEYQVEFSSSEIEKISQGKNIYIEGVPEDCTVIFAKFNGKVVAVLEQINTSLYHPETVLLTEVI
ncbi:MAG TPA: tRNA pseudouridine(55) synthase TruB [Chitinispirillaceae bacterium]|nr:tRNA pseudouridine(55) synthase TruB [Chitinispirillaceae bacterium]